MNKYNATKTEYRGVRYDSKREARFAADLDLRIMAGEVRFWLRQVPFQLIASAYRVDFVVFETDGSTHFIEVKGYDTPVGKLKRKQTEALYPVKIEVVR